MSMLDGIEVLNPGETVHQIEHYTHIDSLISQYRMEHQAIIKMAGYFAEKASTVNFFLIAAKKASSRGSFRADFMFRAEPALRALDAKYWQTALDMTDVMEYMPAARREEWQKHIRDHTTFEFTELAVKDTLAMLLSKRAEFFAEMVDGIFSRLSKGHLTNQPEGFSKRMIFQGTCPYGSLESSTQDVIHDLRCIIGKFMGRDVPTHQTTYRALSALHANRKNSDWNDFDGGAFRLKMYNVGTIHIEIHPDMAYRLNQVLAGLHPMAIPNKYRSRPKPSVHTRPLTLNLIPNAVITELEFGQWDSSTTSLSFYFAETPLSIAAINVLTNIGGVCSNNTNWCFANPTKEKLDSIFRKGHI